MATVVVLRLRLFIKLGAPGKEKIEMTDKQHSPSTLYPIQEERMLDGSKPLENGAYTPPAKYKFTRTKISHPSMPKSTEKAGH
jgi:hypothetical protein